MKIKFTQIAIRVPDAFHCMKRFKSTFDCNIAEDNLKMDGLFNNEKVTNSEIDLTYSFGPIDGVEIEWITSNGHHWHDDIIEKVGDVPFISHFGVYCDDDEFHRLYEYLSSIFKVIQDTISHSHTNKRDTDVGVSSRKYKDVIFDSESEIGFRIKLTVRV